MQSYPNVLESIKDLSYDQINGLMSRALHFKRNIYSSQDTFPKKTPIIASLFLENSTRTINSFAIACKRLGANYLHIDAKTTSLSKGENLKETFLTLKHQGVDMVIMRTPNNNEFTEFKNIDFPLSIVNAGDGTHQHPTQALLDLFTMSESGHDIKGKTVLIVGDCKHSRVARSLIDLLPQFGAKILLCGPKEWVEGFSDNPKIETTQNMDEAIKSASLIYLLRIQKERHSKSSSAQTSEDYHSQYGVNLERLKRLNKLIPVYHPGPFNEGVEISQDIVESPYYFGYKQVEHSTYMRMAIIEKILNIRD